MRAIFCSLQDSLATFVEIFARESHVLHALFCKKTTLVANRGFAQGTHLNFGPAIRAEHVMTADAGENRGLSHFVTNRAF